MSTKRDYKPETTWKTRRRVRRQGLAVIALVLTGLLGSLWAYLSGGERAAVTTSQHQPPAAETRKTSDINKAEPTNTPPPKPKYDFYKVLPERELIIPKDELSTDTPSRKPKSPAAKPADTNTGNHYIVQAGSFRKYTDADRRKASIAFLGIHAYIEAGNGKNGGTWHRVRIGPIEGKKQAQALRQRLQKHNIQSIALRAD